MNSAETLLSHIPQETIMGDYLKTNLAAEHINACVQAVGMKLEDTLGAWGNGR